MRSEVVQYMSEVADQVVILTDSSKFGKKGIVKRFGLKQVSQVVTDTGISNVAVEQLEKASIRVVKV